MDIEKSLVAAIKSGFDDIVKAMGRRPGVMTFQRTHSVTYIHRQHISSIIISDTAVRVITTNGAESFYAVVQSGDDTDYQAALAVLREHDYYIPTFAQRGR